MNLVRSWPQQQAGATPLGWQWPASLVPPRINGWPQGVVPSSDAEALLESAVAWWDASRYRDGDRWLRNQGIAGELLDLRLGSSTVANSNDPTRLGPESTGYVYLPGVGGNWLSVPDENALDITGDIDIRVRVAMDSWTPSAISGLIGKWGPTGNLSYYFRVNTSGTLAILWSPDGTTAAQKFVTSTAATGISNGAVKWVRVTLDVDNGASGNDVKFWTSDDGSTWTQLGITVTTAGTTSIYASTSSLLVGDASTVSGVTSAGKFYRAQVLNGIDGTTVLDVDCDAITSGSATSFTATTGQTVTISRSTSGRKSVAQPARGKGGRACFLLGTDDYFEVPSDRVWQHQLLNFGQGDSSTVLVVIRQWNNTVSTGRYLQKGNTGARYAIYGDSGPAGNALLRDSALASANILSLSFSQGQVIPLAQVVDRASQTVRLYQRTTSSATASTVSIGSTASTDPVSIGRVPTSATSYQDFEFYAAAIFRRALSAAEIRSITSYYGA